MTTCSSRGWRGALASARVRVTGARLHRPPEHVDAVRLRYHARALPCRARWTGAEELLLDLDEPADVAAPGQLAAQLDLERVPGVVVGEQAHVSGQQLLISPANA